ncbi:putative aminotransferase family protein (LolT) [Aspergillus candidus]|uniref:PLP-dependent transferase n=1 Tax=Aspergillus candidus TaxID=41067 RepID=A0A2I2F0K8_ASPCN|nr:PLP-dependent transferase [Aspergillus candidus]PLB34158.1 PLP-dependent transferase [Aspergillus candidus]
MGEANVVLGSGPTPFGKEMKKHFSFAPGYHNLNHGSYGTCPTAIQREANRLRDECEARPCPFIKYRFPELLDESRAAVAQFLGVPRSTVVFVTNATTGVNTVFRNMIWNTDGKDEIIEFDVVYGACGKTADYICETSRDLVRTRQIQLTYPVEDDDFVAAFREAIDASRRDGRRPRIAIFDTISSNPGIRLPFEALTAVCRSEGVLSLIDAAHGIGQIDLNLPSLDPDFLVSNCHKWLFTPRGCAVFYVPERNQAMMRSTIPTSHGFRPRLAQNEEKKVSIAPHTHSEFELNFEHTGTYDNIAFLTVPAAIKWRQNVCGGEEKIRGYCTNLAREGGKIVAAALGTSVLDNPTHTYTDCFMVNILLPVPPKENECMNWRGRPVNISEWMQRTMIEEWQTYMPVFWFKGAWWFRISAQVYLELSDFEWAGSAMKEVCQKVNKLLG